MLNNATYPPPPLRARPDLQLRPQYAPGLFGFENTRRRPRAVTLGDGYVPVLFPEQLAKQLNRPQKLADGWLPVPIPDSLFRSSHA